MTILQSNHRGIHIPSLWMVHAGCVFVAGIHPSRTRVSGSFESMRWNAYRLCLYSHLRKFLGNGVRTHVNSKRKIPSTEGSEEVQTRDAASHRTASPTHYRLSYVGPTATNDIPMFTYVYEYTYVCLSTSACIHVCRDASL